MEKIKLGIVMLIVTVSYFVGETWGVGIGTATYLALLILYTKISN